MRKLTDITEILRQTALRKHRAAQSRQEGSLAEEEDPREVYQRACSDIGKALASDGFRYAKSGPHLTKKHGDFTHSIGFQSDQNNVRGEHVALWIHVNVWSKRLKTWRKRYDPDTSWDFVAGGQIGNLEPPPGWAEWELADPSNRTAMREEAIEAIRSVAYPFFASFLDQASALRTLDQWPQPGLHIVPAIELALSYDDRQRGQALLGRFFELHTAELPEYRSKVSEFQSTGVPTYRDGKDSLELAKVTVLYGLDPL